MLDRLTGKPIHLYLCILSCALIAAGMPLNKVMMSLGTMLGFLNLLLEANFRFYWQNLRENRLAWALWAYIACEWLSLLWTQNMDYALHDFKVKLPLYAIPLFLVARPIASRKQLYGLGALFLLSLLITSVINVGSYQHWWGHRSYDDIRGKSLFCSHIRYALMMVMGIVITVYWIMQKLPYRGIAVVLLLWFTTYTWVSQVLSGYLALGSVVLILILLAVKRIRSGLVQLIVVGSALILVGAIGFQIRGYLQPTPHKMSLKNLPAYTANGRTYWNDTVNPYWENGYPILVQLNEEELALAWNQASTIDYETGTDKKHQAIRFTLWRYMTSMGVSKDSMGFLTMRPMDIEHVENGVASVKLTGTGIKARLYGIQHQLEHSEDPNGHSLLQRLEYGGLAD